MEEKKRQQEMEKRKMREEEERIMRKIEEDNKRMKEELEAEKRKEEEKAREVRIYFYCKTWNTFRPYYAAIKSVTKHFCSTSLFLKVA